MARLPQPGGDSGQWGGLLNEYLEVSHNADGTIKNNSVSNGALTDNSVTVSKLATASQPTSGQALTYTGAELSWASISSSGPTPDASTTTKGSVQLAGDLSGTAAAPTVPGLATKEPAVADGTTSQYYRGDKSWQTLNKAAVGLSNVDNTSDASKPISTLTQAALDTKATTASLAPVATSGRYTDLSDTPTIPVINDASDSTKGVIQLSGDLGGTSSAPTVPGLATKEPAVADGTTSQYYRGDKTWQTLNKAAVGLSNVDNTADAAKPVSTATQAALDAKANASHVHAGEDITTGTIAASRLPVATEVASGVVELSTVAEVITGTDTTRAVTPAGVKAAVDASIGAVPQVLFVNSLSQLPPGTPVDTLVVVRAA